NQQKEAKEEQRRFVEFIPELSKPGSRNPTQQENDGQSRGQQSPKTTFRKIHCGRAVSKKAGTESTGMITVKRIRQMICALNRNRRYGDRHDACPTVYAIIWSHAFFVESEQDL